MRTDKLGAANVQHTRGKWSLNVAINEDNTLDCGEHERYVLSEDNVLIADCYADTALDFGLPETFSEARANARLISAAPELLEALKWAMSWECLGQRWNLASDTERAMIDGARAAIAKAEGTVQHG